jgi:hypothetical protein
MPELGPSGSERGVRRKPHPYRDTATQTSLSPFAKASSASARRSSINGREAPVGAEIKLVSSSIQILPMVVNRKLTLP